MSGFSDAYHANKVSIDKLLPHSAPIRSPVTAVSIVDKAPNV